MIKRLTTYLSQHWRTLLAYLPVASMLCLVATLPFPYSWVQQTCIIALGSTYVIDYVASSRWRQWHWTREKYAYIAFVVFYLLVLLWHPLETTTTPHYRLVLEHRLPFLVVGVVGLLGISDKFRLRYFAYAFLLTSLGMVIYVLCLTGFDHLTDMVDNIWYANEMRRVHVNSHMVVNMYWNISLIFAFYLLASPSSKRYERWAAVVAILPIIAMLMLSEGRTGMFTAIVLVFIFLASLIWKKTKVGALAFLVVGVAAGVVFVSQQDSSRSGSVESNPRYVIWKHTWSLIRERPVLGYGVSDAREVFVEKGQEDVNFVWGYMKGYEYSCEQDGKEPDYMKMHPHNAMLEAMLEFGIVGFICFWLIVILPLLKKRDANYLFLCMTVVAFFMQAMTETIGTHLLPLLYLLPILLWHYGSESTTK